MEVYRIVQEKYADDLTGLGSYTYGGRWNAIGTYALYTSTTRALALLELLAHVPTHLVKAKNYILLTLELPQDLLSHRKILKLSMVSQMVLEGDKILKQNDLLFFLAPSVIVPEEMNIILNPTYVDYEKVTIKESRTLDIDTRLFSN